MRQGLYSGRVRRAYRRGRARGMRSTHRGAGTVTIGIPQSLNDILEIKVTEAMTHPLPEVKRARCLSLRARGEIQRHSAVPIAQR